MRRFLTFFQKEINLKTNQNKERLGRTKGRKEEVIKVNNLSISLSLELLEHLRIWKHCTESLET